MDDVILAKLESLARCIDRIREKTPDQLQLFLDDLDKQDIVVLNLERAIQLCVDIVSYILSKKQVKMAGTMGQTFSIAAENGILSTAVAENLKNAVGFRNIAVHQYTRLDYELVFYLADSKLDDFRYFSQEVYEYTRGL